MIRNIEIQKYTRSVKKKPWWFNRTYEVQIKYSYVRDNTWKNELDLVFTLGFFKTQFN